MRTYHDDSPRAAARILALTLLADGRLSRSELEAIKRLDAPAQLGLDEPGLHAVLQALCEDLLATTYLEKEDTCRVDRRVLARLLGEVRDPALRKRVLELCAAVAESDACLSDAEAAVLGTAVETWGLDLQRSAASGSGRPSGSGVRSTLRHIETRT
jgi:uncharacterized tellurite resistance protein B-like protein